MDSRFLLILALVVAGLGLGTMAIIGISRSGLDKIKAHEALRLRPYKDQAGKWTIGYGHLILPHETNLLTGQITESQALELLKNDLAIAEKAVNNMVTVSITGNQYDALVSLVFNIGIGAFAKSTLLKVLNEKNYTQAAREFLRWKYVGKKVSTGLFARRKREQRLFLA